MKSRLDKTIQTTVSQGQTYLETGNSGYL